MGGLYRHFLDPDLARIAKRVEAGERIGRDDGMVLATHPDLTSIGAIANVVRERLHGDRKYFVRNQHVNYTNICNKFCKFCSFYAKKGGPEPYELSLADVKWRLEKHADTPLTEIHMVGGINPRLPYE